MGYIITIPSSSVLEFSTPLRFRRKLTTHWWKDRDVAASFASKAIAMFSKLHGPGRLVAGASTTSKPFLARSVGSLPPRQAQVSDVGKAINRTSVTSFFQHLPRTSGHLPTKDEEYKLPTPFRGSFGSEKAVGAHPVVSAIPRNRDEFWRKVPVWQDVSATDFLSYRWSVSQRLNPNMSVDHGVTSCGCRFTTRFRAQPSS